MKRLIIAVRALQEAGHRCDPVPSCRVCEVIRAMTALKKEIREAREAS